MSGSLGDIRLDGQESSEGVVSASGEEDAPAQARREGTRVNEGPAGRPTTGADPLGAERHTTTDPESASGGASAWDDGLIARRAQAEPEVVHRGPDHDPVDDLRQAACPVPVLDGPSGERTGTELPEYGRPRTDETETPRAVAAPTRPTAAGTGVVAYPGTPPGASPDRPAARRLAWADDLPGQVGDLPVGDLLTHGVGEFRPSVEPQHEVTKPASGVARVGPLSEAPQSSAQPPAEPRLDSPNGLETTAPRPSTPGPEPLGSPPPARQREPRPYGGERGLGRRLLALRELVGLSRTRCEPDVLAEAVRVLDEAAARGRLSRAHTTVAVAGPTGCGKSSLFNALAGAQLSEVAVRRPTTSTPVACVWETSERSGGVEGLLERLGVPPRARRRVHLRDVRHRELGGLVLLDFPDHDSLAAGHREQADRLLRLVDAVIWVVDPEKYADAVLHERYLRPLAGHAEVTYVVLNQADRLPPDTTGELLDDLRRLLDEDGMALGEHGDPGAQVLSLSALTGEGVGELRESLGELVHHRLAAARRLAADVDRVVADLHPVCVGEEPTRPTGLTPEVRERFEERLGVAVGATAAGQNAERVWLRQADLACGTSWAGLARWQVRRAGARRGEKPGGWAVRESASPESGRTRGSSAISPSSDEARVEAARVEVAPAASAVATVSAAPSGEPGERATTLEEVQYTGRPVVEQAVRGLVDDVVRGLPAVWARATREAASKGGDGLSSALDRAVAGARLPVRPERPRWWTVAAMGQAVLLAFQLIGVLWLLVGLLAGGMGPERWLPFALLMAGALGGPLLAWGCRTAARGPARTFGLEQESRLRRIAADCGRGLVLEPVAAELLRYSEVRQQYVTAAGGPEKP